MNVDVTTTIDIDRPCAEVADYANDPSNAPDWYVNIQTVEWQTEPPVKLGSKCAFVAHFLGRRMEYVYEVVEYEPNRRMVMRTVDGPFPMETIYTYQSIDASRTRVQLRNRGKPTGFSKVVSPLMMFAMRRANNKDLSLLKKVLEVSANLETD